MIVTSECVQHCSTWNSYVGLMTDVPHILFEFTLEFLTAPIAYVLGRYIAKREHHRIDVEHGVVHTDHPPSRTAAR